MTDSADPFTDLVQQASRLQVEARRAKNEQAERLAARGERFARDAARAADPDTADDCAGRARMALSQALARLEG